MELNEYEQRICKALNKRDADGHVHCFECPLVMDKETMICRANATKEDWEDMARWAENGYL